MSHLLDPDLEFRALEIDELRVMATRNGGSVLRRGRALMELGRRASGDPALLGEVAGLVRAPENSRLLTVGSVSVSQLGVAGLVAGGSDGAFALATELAGEWPRDERSDFALLMRSSGIAWSSESRTDAAARGSAIAEAGEA
jgi:hypothetical protein